ncbi:MAG: hypothetical protein DRH04_05935 [Deltaproteobacteria bacterium]|nr:MAG: hypothetical protein DRH04_05935 [Deltaproteobacteria bacterium]
MKASKLMKFLRAASASCEGDPDVVFKAGDKELEVAGAYGSAYFDIDPEVIFNEPTEEEINWCEKIVIALDE